MRSRARTPEGQPPVGTGCPESVSWKQASVRPESVMNPHGGGEVLNRANRGQVRILRSPGAFVPRTSSPRRNGNCSSADRGRLGDRPRSTGSSRGRHPVRMRDVLPREPGAQRRQPRRQRQCLGLPHARGNAGGRGARRRGAARPRRQRRGRLRSGDGAEGELRRHREPRERRDPVPPLLRGERRPRPARATRRSARLLGKDRLGLRCAPALQGRDPRLRGLEQPVGRGAPPGLRGSGARVVGLEPALHRAARGRGAPAAGHGPAR